MRRMHPSLAWEIVPEGIKIGGAVWGRGMYWGLVTREVGIAANPGGGPGVVRWWGGAVCEDDWDRRGGKVRENIFWTKL